MNRCVLALAALTAVSIPAVASAQAAPAGVYNFDFASSNYNGSGTLTVGSGGLVTSMSGTVDDNGVTSSIFDVVAPGTYASNDNVLSASAPYVDLYGLGFSLADGNIFNLFTYFNGLNYETNLVANPGGTDYGGALTGSEQLTTLNVAAVPEPATWAMFLLGFGAIGFALRRNNARHAVPQLA